MIEKTLGKRTMGNSFRLALAQVNVTVGDLKGNSQKITEIMRRAAQVSVEPENIDVPASAGGKRAK